MRVQSRLDELTRKLKSATDQALSEAGQKMQLREAALKQRDPQPWMREGWTQLFDDKGLVRSGKDLSEGQALKARLPDALIEVEVTRIKNTDEKGL